MSTDEFKPAMVALYRDDRYGYTTIWALNEDGTDAHENYVRISEPVQVQFKPLPKDVVIQNAIAALDAEEREARIKLEHAIANIRDRKARFLSLIHEESAQ